MSVVRRRHFPLEQTAPVPLPLALLVDGAYDDVHASTGASTHAEHISDSAGVVGRSPTQSADDILTVGLADCSRDDPIWSLTNRLTHAVGDADRKNSA